MTERLTLDNLPYYGRVPKTPRKHLEYRRDVLRLCAVSREAREQFWMACARDPLFWMNTFCFTHDPRKVAEGLSPVIPLNTWKFQDELILDIFNHIYAGKDLGIRKSRCMTATWSTIYVHSWLWQFIAYSTFLWVSRAEELVYRPGKPGSLMWKHEFIYKPEHMPEWLSPNIERGKLVIRNLDNDAVINGMATTGDVGRSDRCTSLFADEFAMCRCASEMVGSTASTANSRIFNSTPKGMSHTFYRLEKNGEMDFRVLLWPEHPEYRRGLYYDHEGKKRSPWYDHEVTRYEHPLQARQEVDGENLGSESEFYGAQLIEDYIAKYSREPVWVGDLDPNLDKPRLEADEHGQLQLWIDPEDIDPEGDYVWGADISQGAGATPSVLSIGDRATNTIIGEYANAWIYPIPFANLCCALGRIFKGRYSGAYGVWERNAGGGVAFSDELLATHYQRVYWQTTNDIRQKETLRPGWLMDRENKYRVLSRHRAALEAAMKDEPEGALIDPGRAALEETHQYIYVATGHVVNSESLSIPDPSGQRINHGDRVISRALTWFGMRVAPNSEKIEPPKKTPYGCPKWRMELREERAARTQPNRWKRSAENRRELAHRRAG